MQQDFSKKLATFIKDMEDIEAKGYTVNGLARVRQLTLSAKKTAQVEGTSSEKVSADSSLPRPKA